MRAIPPHIAITYQPKSVYELGKRGVPSARPSTTISPDTCNPMTQPLSPAAQAVLDAYGNEIGSFAIIMGSERRGLAAALRAAAVNGGIKTRGGGVILDCRSILAIAAELEAHHG